MNAAVKMLDIQTQVSATNLFALIIDVNASTISMCRPMAGVHATKNAIATPIAILCGESSMWSILCVMK